MWTRTELTDKRMVFSNSNTGEMCSLSAIATHESGVYYAFDNLLQMPYQRKYIFDLAQQYERIGMDKKELEVHLNDIQEMCRNKADGFELNVYSKIDYIKQNIKDVWDFQKTALLTAAMVIVTPDENIAVFDQSLAEKKINEWSKDKNLLSFFLNVLQQRCTTLIEPFNTFTQSYSHKVSQ